MTTTDFCLSCSILKCETISYHYVTIMLSLCYHCNHYVTTMLPLLPLCYHYVTTMLPLCYHYVTTMLPLCYHYVTTMLPLCYHYVTAMLTLCLLHADDTALLSTDRKSFVNKCNLMLKYFEENHLSLNLSKSGYMIINCKNPDEKRI